MVRSSRKNRIMLVLLLMTLPLVQAGTCSDDDTSNPLDPEDQEFTTNVSLLLAHQQFTECLHLFSPGEDFPCCQVCPGGFAGRTVAMTLKNGSSYTFRAGRNGEILAEKSCTVRGGRNDEYQVTMLSGGLDCTGGFR